MSAIRVIGLVVAAWILGAAPPPAEAKGSVKITFTGTPAPLQGFAPRNVVAVWIQDQGGAFVKTVAKFAVIEEQRLVTWRAASAGNVVDAVTGPTRAVQGQPQTVAWSLRDRQGNVVPDGTYTIRLELAEGNSTTAAQNNQGTFTFIKGPAPQTQTNLTNGGFTNVSIEFDPNAVACADGIVDTPEKCDR